MTEKRKQRQEPTQYKWRRKDDVTRNICVYEITRSTDQIPFTVLIHDYTTRGDIQLFSDLFWSDDWDEERGKDGQVSDDVKFCIQLWKDLGLKIKTGEDFQPKHIVHDLERFPTVYRNTLENVMNIRYGCGHTKVFDNMNCMYVNSTQEGNIIRVPVKLDVNMTDEQVETTIKNAIDKKLYE